MQDDLSLSSIRYPVSRIRYLYEQNGKYFLDAPYGLTMAFAGLVCRYPKHQHHQGK